MYFFRQTKRIYIYALWCLLLLFSTSCNSSEVSAPGAATIEMTPLPTSAQPVEYGASLSEWEEAAQADAEQTANRDETNTEAVKSQEITATEIIPTAIATSDEVTEVATALPTEELVTLTEQTVNLDETKTEMVETETTPSAEITLDEVISPVEVVDDQPTEEPIIIEESPLYVFNDVTYEEIEWDGLIPADFTPAALMGKYEEQLAQFEDGSSEASDLYAQMQEEFNNAPVNEAINETFVRIPGFIAPLEYADNVITEFLLVPYFGACIHVPPPPANQTVLVKVGEGYGIKLEESYNPVWIMGKLTTEGATTELANAGYHIQDAIIEPYTSP